ncbi:putative lipoprotein [Sphaerisporangium melleum]|uniref:Lipoprotein n=1 Tax=Sphaerisporangium melleum TaxID=321316 RepID=A0A917QRC7_9ACTN|nr:hypothetical protein [Sphaerisporangium melleum]GGK64541.1 putative lipoprotein [Sphaerisporangium melleum]GII70067.1 putative lipoprotein [Sphaerisporangium melleum]
MTTTMRVALALFLLAGSLMACSSPPAPRSGASSATPSASPTEAAPREAPAVGLAEAGRVLREILAADDAARASGAESYALEQTRDAQRDLTRVAFTSTGLRPPRYTWGKPELLVPRLKADRYPYWFAAVAERRDGHGRRRTAVLAFMKQYETSMWQLSFASLLYPGTSPPAVLLDDEGYATALATRDDSIAISPHLMAPLHATIAEEGPRGFAASLIAPGPQTTGYFDEVEKIQPDYRTRGLLYDSLFAATAFPIFALRTTDGGAVILYSLRRTTLRQAKIKSAEGLVPVPKAVRWAVPSQVVPSMLRMIETQQDVSQVARKGAAERARIIGFDGAATEVTGR